MNVNAGSILIVGVRSSQHGVPSNCFDLRYERGGRSVIVNYFGEMS